MFWSLPHSRLMRVYKWCVLLLLKLQRLFFIFLESSCYTRFCIARLIQHTFIISITSVFCIYLNCHVIMLKENSQLFQNIFSQLIPACRLVTFYLQKLLETRQGRSLIARKLVLCRQSSGVSVTRPNRCNTLNYSSGVAGLCRWVMTRHTADRVSSDMWHLPR